jgi:hypothetical protein
MEIKKNRIYTCIKVSYVSEALHPHVCQFPLSSMILRDLKNLFHFFPPPCYVGPCHHGMARPRFANGGYGLQIWRVAANILKKESRSAD